MQLFLHDSSQTGISSVFFYITGFILPQRRTGPILATWSSGHAICEDSGSSIWKKSGIMMWDRRKEPWAVPGLGRREGGCRVVDWGELDVPAPCQTEGRCVGPSTLASFSWHLWSCFWHHSHHFDLSCGGHLLFAYVCWTGVFTVLWNLQSAAASNWKSTAVTCEASAANLKFQHWCPPLTQHVSWLLFSVIWLPANKLTRPSLFSFSPYK